MLSAVAETWDCGFLAAGCEFDTLQQLDALYLLRTDSVGTLLWTRQIAVPGAATRAVALRSTSDGGYVIAGSIDWGIDSARAWLVKTDADAETTWTRVLPGTGREQAADIEQTADGGYAIAGTSDSANGSILLVKTDSLGGMLTGLAEGTPAIRERFALSVTPNPTSGVARIRCSLPGKIEAKLRIYDVTGRQVHSSFGLRHSEFRLDLGSMPAGVYLLKLEYDGGAATRKLVIE